MFPRPRTLHVQDAIDYQLCGLGLLPIHWHTDLPANVVSAD